ncbi:hypothetical protein A1O3_04509 [Capronia epimyces CBS 606.96]|uniref:AB hydrolase-1 domain-containing protein n=1 Tax=Capronia epimyces CBS 606.96 TaxID=1182542 RepID=W9YZ30_9EURO|nr:uncharacterized protein A1O3_04509 [Capronia epimyces CBS 606.96]EXJ87549.1 hypothetical protein A1O3_04509 [Capronia epimyces CBS 606.96]
MSKPSLLLIPGSFCPPELYDQVVDPVIARGYEIRALHLPSVGLAADKGREGSLPTMYDDAAFIAQEAEKLADQGKAVVLIAHSYGGVPTTQSVKGLAASERKKQGKPGGIVRLAYMTSLVPAVGVSAAGVLAEVPQEQKLDLKIDETGWMYHDQPSATAAITVNHLTPAEGEAVIRRFARHSSVSFGGELTYPGYKDVPVSYLLCEDDLCIPPNIQKAEIDMIEKESGNKVRVTRIPADHCPNITSTQETIDWIVDVAEQAQA